MQNALVLALATHRLTQLVVEDEITRPVRTAVDDWARGAPELSLKERIDFALNCPACSSIWAAALVLGISAVPGGKWIVRGLALSGAALGWKAVLDKLEAR